MAKRRARGEAAAEAEKVAAPSQYPRAGAELHQVSHPSKKRKGASSEVEFPSLPTVSESAAAPAEESKPEQPSSSLAVSQQPETFEDLGLRPELLDVITRRGWKDPTPIQLKAIPPALEGKDIIGLAVTGSGKTGAFVLPILNAMLGRSVHAVQAVCITPTRELATQIAEQFNALGAMLALKVATLTGGLSVADQQKMLARGPHVVVATPGRLVDHLQNTTGFNLKRTEFLVMDEADRLLTIDFDRPLKEIIRGCNSQRQTFLFSATMTTKVEALQRLSLQNPVKATTAAKTQTNTDIKQYMALVPFADKFAYTAALLRKFAAYRAIVFCNTCKIANVFNAFLKYLGFQSIALSGDMKQTFRLAALRQFKQNEKKILVTTEVGSRGLDIPAVNMVVNFDVPMDYKDYIHRIGRTGRAGARGEAYTLVTQHSLDEFCNLEKLLNIKLEPFKELTRLDYQDLESREAKLAAEHEYSEATKKNLFKKKKAKNTA